MQKNFEKIHFYSDGIKLTGYLHNGHNINGSYVIGSHGLLSDANSGKQINLADKLFEKNIGYLRFHHRGCGESDGDLSKTNLQTRQKDLISALNFLKNRCNVEKTGLFGSSMGGATCISGYDNIKPVASVLLASPIKGRSMEESFSGSIDILMKETGLEKSFFLKNIDFDLVKYLHRIKNTLVIHGDNDQVVPFSNGKLLYNNINDEKKFLVFKNGDHRVENLTHQKKFIDEAVKWFINFL